MPYFFDHKLFIASIYRAFFKSSELETSLGVKRLLFLVLVMPLFLLLQISHFIGFVIDELLFSSYKKVDVKNPLFIVGVPRSGTTFMQRLLSLDEQFSAITSWEMMLAPSITEKIIYRFMGKLDGLMGSPFKKMIIAFENKAFAEFNKIHKFGMFEAEEDEFLLVNSFTSTYLIFFFPDMRVLEKYDCLDTNMVQEKRHKIMEYRKALIQKHLYVYGTDKTYIAKNPADCIKITTIFEVFPNARMIYLVRTPYQTIPSLMNLMSHLFKVANDNVDNKVLIKLIEGTFPGWYKQACASIENAPQQKCKVVFYDDMVADPKAVAEQAYAHLGYEVSASYLQVLIQQTEKAKQYKSKHAYDVSNYGITNEDILNIYKDVFEYYNFEQNIALKQYA